MLPASCPAVGGRCELGPARPTCAAASVLIRTRSRSWGASEDCLTAPEECGTRAEAIVVQAEGRRSRFEGGRSDWRPGSSQHLTRARTRRSKSLRIQSQLQCGRKEGVEGELNASRGDLRSSGVHYLEPLAEQEHRQVSARDSAWLESWSAVMRDGRRRAESKSEPSCRSFARVFSKSFEMINFRTGSDS